MDLTHRYVLNGSPHHCAFCSEPFRGEAHRRGTRYFCNELCADATREPVRLKLVEQDSAVQNLQISSQ
jgi:hypothetical protein